MFMPERMRLILENSRSEWAHFTMNVNSNVDSRATVLASDIYRSAPCLLNGFHNGTGRM